MKEDIDDLILKTVSRILSPFILVFSLYVLAHGHISPGGGFQGGCIMASAFILLSLSFGFENIEKRLREKSVMMFLGTGVLIYAFTGVFSYLFGKNFLDYGWLSKVLPLSPAKARYIGIFFVEIGVHITVFACMFSIFSDLLKGREYGVS